MNEKLGGILLVVDNKAMNETLAQTLASLEQQVTVANEARQALALIGVNSFELVLFSVRLPDMAAQEFLARMKDTGGIDAVTTIVIGDPDQGAELEQCLRAGADDFLITPISTGLLKARVQFVLEHKRLRHKYEHRIESEELLKIEHDIQIARRIQAGFLPETLPNPRGGTWPRASNPHARWPAISTMPSCSPKTVVWVS